MIKAIALDVDGVLTDGAFWWDGADAELKRPTAASMFANRMNLSSH